jgi:hypothetical protein
MPEQQYTLVHPVDHQTYHTDRRTAQLLQDVKRREMTGYAAAFEHGRKTGRIVEGVAPAQRQASAPHPPGVARVRSEQAHAPSVGD